MRSSHSLVLSFLIFQAVSAATGYLLARKFGESLARKFISLGLFGYLVSALGAVFLILDIQLKLGLPAYLFGLATLGFALGVIETLEPSLISVISKESGPGRGFGALSSSRSLGLFVGNIVMGLLYQIGASWSYGYAAIVATIAAAIVVFTAKRLKSLSGTIDG